MARISQEELQKIVADLQTKQNSVIAEKTEALAQLENMRVRIYQLRSGEFGNNNHNEISELSYNIESANSAIRKLEEEIAEIDGELDRVII